MRTHQHLCNILCKVIFKSGLHLTAVCNFYSNSIFICMEHSLKDHPWLAIIRKWYLTFPKPYPFILLERKHFALFVFLCVFKEESTRVLLTFLTKSLLPEFQMLDCKSGFSRMPEMFQPYLNKACTHFYLSLLEKFWLKTSEWKV